MRPSLPLLRPPSPLARENDGRPSPRGTKRTPRPTPFPPSHPWTPCHPRSLPQRRDTGCAWGVGGEGEGGGRGRGRPQLGRPDSGTPPRHSCPRTLYAPPSSRGPGEGGRTSAAPPWGALGRGAIRTSRLGRELSSYAHTRQSPAVAAALHLHSHPPRIRSRSAPPYLPSLPPPCSSSPQSLPHTHVSRLPHLTVTAPRVRVGAAPPPHSPLLAPHHPALSFLSQSVRGPFAPCVSHAPTPPPPPTHPIARRRRELFAGPYPQFPPRTLKLGPRPPTKRGGRGPPRRVSGPVPRAVYSEAAAGRGPARGCGGGGARETERELTTHDDAAARERGWESVSARGVRGARAA